MTGGVGRWLQSKARVGGQEVDVFGRGMLSSEVGKVRCEGRKGGPRRFSGAAMPIKADGEDFGLREEQVDGLLGMVSRLRSYRGWGSQHLRGTWALRSSYKTVTASPVNKQAALVPIINAICR